MNEESVGGETEDQFNARYGQYKRAYTKVYNRVTQRAWGQLAKRHPEEFQELRRRLFLDDPLPVWNRNGGEHETDPCPNGRIDPR